MQKNKTFLKNFIISDIKTRNFKFKNIIKKKSYRKINFFQNLNFIGIVFSIEHDPYRNSNVISIFNFKNNKFFYGIAANYLIVGHIVKSGFYAEIKIGHTMILRKIPVGCCVFNITFKTNGLSKISRSAGTYSLILKKTKKYAVILLTSGKKKKIPLNCFASIGTVSKQFFLLTEKNKAGKSRWLNKKPKVRGVAKNPVDHPNGGGEGKKSKQRKTPWGKLMNSYKNVKFKK